MATLIVIVLFGLIISYFANQNTEAITLNFLNYSLPAIPLYIVVGGALLIGLLISWIISLVNDIGTSFALSGKESKIKDYKKENAELVKRINQLESENTSLKADKRVPERD